MKTSRLLYVSQAQLLLSAALVVVFLSGPATARAAAPSCAPAIGFTGHVCTPDASQKHPAILLLGGSEGGDRMQYVLPQLAQRGYVAASVAYFGSPGLPQTLESIPVETVGHALSIVAARSDVDPQKIAIMGVSKGGELALLAASLYPQIHAVVADVPSPFAWQGIAQTASTPQSSWTFGGKPVPYVAYGVGMYNLFGGAFASKEPLRLRAGYDASMKEHADQVPAAMFHLENIRGPVLFVFAGADGIWNSQQQSEMGLAYLRAHHHAYDDEMVNYPSAGHLFLFATAQRPLTSAPLGPFTLALGGTTQANVDAAAQAWPKIMEFLGNALK